jgi:rod shape-determining protein MreC
MFSLYRWWERYRTTLILGTLGAGAALYLRHTNAAVVTEVYRIASLPFQPNLSQQDRDVQARTWELQQRVSELEQQNRQLRSLLGQPAVTQSQSIGAAIIGRSADHWWQQVTLGRGSNDQVRLDAAVMAPGGLIGRVVSLTPNTSRVLLLTDPSSRVGVVLGRQRQMGILRGQANRQTVVEFFVKDPKVKPGDVVVTSALSSLFPAGLPVGRVTSVSFSDPAKPYAIVELTAPIAQLEWATVTLNARSAQTVSPPRP